MATNQRAFFRKRYWRILLTGVAVIAFAIFGLHIWFVNNARGVLKEIVHSKSKGKIKLELSQLSFNFISNKLQVRQADLVSTDTLNEPTTYRIKFRKLTLRVNSFWPLILQKKLLLDSIKLHDPEVMVMQWKQDTTLKISKSELSLSQEMGRLYNSMLDVLDGFGIRRIIINNAKLTLVNKMKAGIEPVVVSNIFFDLFRTASNVKKRDQFVKDEQSVELITTDQNIALPGGRHRLAFKKFHLELFSKRIRMDSCTVTAIATDSSKSSYNVFFKKLLLVGVDFDAMYRLNLIRADSVYCENPLFNIEINTAGAGKKETGNKKERPDPDKIIRELTGDLDLAFVGVKDAGIHINISGKKNRSLFNSNKDDFEMRGLRINADSTRPVVVKRFDMLVRDYRLFNEDSSSAYTLDSIHFINNKIVLNNFTVATSATGQNINHNKKDFSIPYFELTGLDWYELIFEQNLKAREAALYSPVIKYIKTSGSGNGKKVNLFTSLQNLDSLIALEKIDIINGQVDVRLGKAASFDLRNVNLSLFSNRALQSTNKEGLRRAVDHLSFSNGLVRIKDISARLQNVRYTGSNLIKADKLYVTSASNKVNATISSVVMDNLLLDEKAETVVLEGLRWGSATLDLQAGPGSKNKSTGTLNLKNISGSNTSLNFKNGSTSISTFIPSLKLASLFKDGNRPIELEGLEVAGKGFVLNSQNLRVKAGSYQVMSNGISYLNEVDIKQIKGRDSLYVQSPRINFSIDINGTLAKDIHLTNVQAISPVIDIAKWKTEASAANGKKPSIRIDHVVAEEPVINIRSYRNDSLSLISLPKSANSSISLTNVVMNDNGLKLGSFKTNTTTATFVKPTGEVFGVEKGIVKIDVSNIELSNKDGQASWSGLVNNMFLQNPNSLSFGKNKSKLIFNQVSLGNLSLSSKYLSSFNELLKYNVSAWLRTATGQYADSSKVLNWYNAEYNYKSGTLSLDSFSYQPAQPRDSVIANTPYQTDYITFQSGAIKFTDFNLKKYETDTSLFANTITVTNPIITIYRDKQPPFLAGIIKALPVEMIKRITLPVSVQRVNLIDGTLLYSEKHAKTRAEGTLLLAHMNGSLTGIKNRNLGTTDSLTLALNAQLMDSALISLRVRESYADTLSGFLMTLRMRPTSLSFLNPVIAPLSNVIITSGVIDSLHLRAIGHDKLSFGKMNMYYHDLKIKLVKDGEEDKSSFMRDVATFLANTFIIKKNNNGRTGIVYFERLRDKSFFNYIVKMTFSGMATSVGAVKNRKYLKKYKRLLEEKSLPPIDFE